MRNVGAIHLLPHTFSWRGNYLLRTATVLLFILRTESAEVPDECDLLLHVSYSVRLEPNYIIIRNNFEEK
jgi:hypothetical protein